MKHTLVILTACLMGCASSDPVGIRLRNMTFGDEVRIVGSQIPGGEVISAAISGQCNGDEATRRSILAAVERGGALPYRGFEDAFQREIDFNFIYDGD